MTKKFTPSLNLMQCEKNEKMREMVKHLADFNETQ